MFIIGIIIGIIVGIVALYAVSRFFCTRVMFASSKEFDDVYEALLAATKNRVCCLQVVNEDGEILYSTILEDWSKFQEEES